MVEETCDESDLNTGTGTHLAGATADGRFVSPGEVIPANPNKFSQPGKGKVFTAVWHSGSMRADNNVAETPAATANRPSWLVWTLALAVGLAGGVLTSYGQTVLGDGWSALANSASPWVMFAFAAGLFVPGRWPTAALAGLLTQVGLVLGYYATTELRGFAAGIAAIVIWVAAGTVAGPVYGAAGAQLRYGHSGSEKRSGLLVRVCAAGVTGSVWIMEGLNFFSLATEANSFSGPGVAAGWAYVIVGVALPLLLARPLRERLYSLVVLAVATGLAVLAGLVLGAAFFL